MLKERMTMLIMSCDGFSDLWSGHIKQLQKHWPDHGMRTVIVTDKETNLSFSGIEILPICNVPEWTDRLKLALDTVATEYVFVTLDDYFLIKDVDSANMAAMIQMMATEKLDYLRFYLRPKRATAQPLAEYKKIHWVDTQYVYSVNLYSCIWRKQFLEATVAEPRNIWRYEVSLARSAREYGARCAMSKNEDFKILDVVRKGKLLHKSARYFKEHPGIYEGNRAVNTWKYEFSLAIQTFFARHMPRPVVNAARNFMIKQGHHFYSQEQ